MTYQFKIQLRGITKPPVWRRVLVPDGYTFYNLHCIIQEAFGWQYEHLYQFQERPYERGGWRIKEQEDLDDDFLSWLDFNPQAQNPQETNIGKFLNDNPIKKFVYWYDFGDDWIHDITVEAVTEDTLIHPRCLAGKGACPPEDCGGVWDYEYMKMTLLEKPRSNDARMYRQWLGLGRGETFDPKAFDLDAVNKRLSTF